MTFWEAGVPDRAMHSLSEAPRRCIVLLCRVFECILQGEEMGRVDVVLVEDRSRGRAEGQRNRIEVDPQKEAARYQKRQTRVLERVQSI